MTPEQRFQAVLAQSKQHDDEESQRSKLENNLIVISHELKELADTLEEQVTDLIFIEMDKFLESQGWTSEFNNAKNKRYSLNHKNIYITALKPVSGKFLFVIKHDLFNSTEHRVEVCFKDSTTLSHFKTAMQGGDIKNDIPIKALEDWLKGLQLTQQQLKIESEKLQPDGLTYEIIKVGQIHHKRLPNFIEAFLSILENR
ncbi:hypothetical protein LZZ98_15240 [Acinetobacter sp. SM34]|uniref:hypothetical protein n=1 Tax=Acinetobacter sp. SM34 TaxID=1301620 RepID=UPI001EDADDC7|nr:hypothetical protein [Acinetobacter sp. SM34]MCG2609850.1 hypothetical protein [Acinetobacter sp. SM34]